jgi:Carboxypeptidase regulatory-like domain
MEIKRLCFAALWVLALIAMMTVTAPAGKAQVSAALSGTVTDASGAVVPGANVVLKSETSGDLRRTVSNSDGYFTFAAVPPGSYSVKVEMTGFAAWEVTTLLLNAGDKRNIAGIVLKPGATKETITVEAISDQITPVDSGERSTVITGKVMQNVAIVGQNAAEFIKIMPGMAMTAGALNQASYAGADEATGNGPVQNFSSNGLRAAALDITSDGAHVVDPGCNCGQSVNTNIEMTAEVKVLTSNFSADNSKGPAVISAIGKSGGSQFHGSGYFYARHASMNANDSIGNSLGLTADGKPLAGRPNTSYWYPGFNIGGPVIFPHSNFNKNRDKVFFFVGTQYYKQNVDNGYYMADVPTAAMRKGDFSDSAYLSKLAVGGSGLGGTPTNQGFVGGIVPLSSLKTQTGVALVNAYPLPNVDPGSGATKGYNYVNSQTRYSNMFQIRPKIDFNITDNTKFYISYNLQRDSRQESLDTLWTGNGQSWASPTVPYPTPILEKTHSDQVTANLTHVFSPTLTNETVFTYTYLYLPNTLTDRTKVERGSLGIDYKMLFDHADVEHLTLPQSTGWGDGIANVLNGGFELNGTAYAKKSLPNLSDNLSKVWGKHTAKFGFYWERTFNSQPDTNAVNGQGVYATWVGGSTGNVYADMLVGQMNYSERNFDVIPAFRYMSVDFYGQDSWKVSQRLTLEYGIRVQHLGPWSDLKGNGFATWDASQYSATAPSSELTGFAWHKIDSSVPLSGAKSRALFYNPRVGIAWDIFGNGKTVLRGGYGMYRYHDEQNVQNPAYGITAGAYSASLGGVNFSQVGNGSQAFNPGDLFALDPKDDQQPRTQSYSLTVAQRLPWKSVLEVAYVGNKADYLSNYNNSLYQQNYIPLGGLISKYGWIPNITTAASPCNSWETGSGYCDNMKNATRPYPTYGAVVKVINHKMYSNYNGMQVSWNKQSGHFTFMLNYTFSKALGIRGENGAAVGDPLNIKNDYGTLPNNRTHIFNAAYVYELPTASKANPVVRGLVGGWQISGMTQFQSGADLQAAVSANLYFSAYIPAGTTYMGKTLTTATQASADNMLGSGDLTLMPLLTCDPRKGLGKNQYFNPSCFTLSSPGTNGNYIWPTLTGPAFFNSDLSLFKNFTFGSNENKKLQFRFSAYNFLNHPVRTFLAGDNNLKLNFDATGNLVNDRTGYADHKTGHRILQLMAKFTF